MAFKVNGFTRYTVCKGWHWFLPLRFDYFKSDFQKLIWRGYFSESCRYDLKDNDQKDWNKGGGITNDFWTNKNNSLRWVWRYNKQTEKIELGGYAYVNGWRITSDFVFTAAINQDFTVSMYRSAKRPETLVLQFDKIEKGEHYGVTWEVPFDEIPAKVRRELLYFGGNEKAPNRMHVFLKFEKK